MTRQVMEVRQGQLGMEKTIPPFKTLLMRHRPVTNFNRFWVVSGFTINKSGNPNSYILIMAADDNNKPIITSNSKINGDYIEVDHLNFSNGDLSPTGKYIIIRHCDFADMGSDYGQIDIPASDVTGLLIEHNEFQGSGPDWAAIYVFSGNHDQPQSGSIVIRHNKFDAFRDAIGNSSNDDRDGGLGDSSDFHDNIITNGTDDGIENEGGCINVRIYNNYIKEQNSTLYNAIGSVVVSIGPIYYWNNVVNGGGDGAFKVGKASTGAMYVYFNTLHDVGNFINLTDSPRPSNITAMNNIFTGKSGSTYFYYKVVDSIDPEASGHNFDFQMGTRTFNAKYTDNSYATLSSWINTTGFDTNTFKGDPYFENPDKDDFSLKEYSDAIDAGIPIPGISLDRAGFKRDSDPDIGAYEFGRPKSPKNFKLVVE